MLQAFLEARLGSGAVFVYDPLSWVRSIAELRKELTAATVVTLLIGPTFFTSGPCCDEALDVVTQRTDPATFAVATVGGARLEQVVQAWLNRTGGSVVALDDDVLGWNGFEEIERFSNQIFDRLKALGQLPPNPRTAPATNPVPESVARHCPAYAQSFGGASAGPGSLESTAVHTSALFVSHLQQVERGAALCSGLYGLAVTAPLQVVGPTTAQLAGFFVVLQNAALTSVLHPLGSPAEQQATSTRTGWVRTRTALLLRLRAYLERHFPSGLTRTWVPQPPGTPIVTTRFPLIAVLTNLVLPRSIRPDPTWLLSILNEVYIRALAASIDFSGRFFPAAAVGSAPAIQPLPQLVAFNDQQRQRFTRA